MPSMNFSDLLANAEGVQPIPAGTYEANVERANVRTTSKGKTMFSVMFRIVGGPHNHKTVWSNFTISPESPVALGIFFRQMDALGLNAEFFSTNPDPEEVADALVGKSAKITVRVTEYQGNPKNEITSINRSERPEASNTAKSLEWDVPF